MTNGWEESAAAWIAEMGETGDWSRRHVLDAPMLARARAGAFRDALDVGCGEGRFSRMLQAAGLRSVGVDPSARMIASARARDPAGDYRIGAAEALGFPDGAFDLVVSYLTLIDIAGLDSAVAEMARVLKPGGALLVANLNSFFTAGPPEGWSRNAADEPTFCIDRYLEERVEWISWAGLRVQNWHRPLSRYMSAFLAAGLRLEHFDEPRPEGADPKKTAHYERVPLFVVMEWRKP